MKTFDNKWEEIHSSKEWGKYPCEEVIRFVARNYYKFKRENIKALDFGCGTGAITWYLAREGFDVYAFDGSKSAVDSANERIKEEKLNAKIKVADGGNTEYDDNTFDFIINSGVFACNTVNGIKELLSESSRVLKTGGKLFSSGLFGKNTTGFNSKDKIEENTFKNLDKGILANLGTIHFFDKDEISLLWSSAGFKINKIDCITRTENNGKILVQYYLVEAEKK